MSAGALLWESKNGAAPPCPGRPIDLPYPHVLSADQMHSSTALRSEDFEVIIDGRRAEIGELLPGFEEASRLGVVVREDFGAVGASSLVLAAVTAFYDIQRDRHPEGFFRYADFFIFHVGRLRGNHHMLDVSPDHKEVVVEDDPEAILQAVNDRAVSHLVVPDGVAAAADFQAQTENGARARIEGALVYSPGGRVHDADVEIKGNECVDEYVAATLEGERWADEAEAEEADPKMVAWARSRLGEVPPEVADAILAERRALQVEGRTIESYRRASLDQALGLLVPAEPGRELGLESG